MGDKDKLPSLTWEKKYRKRGRTRIAGIDEAGRGPIAGPVVAAAASLPKGFRNFGIRDSKLIGEKKRESLFSGFRDKGIVYSVGIVGQSEIDRLNIYRATRRAMEKAVRALADRPDMLLIDGMELPETDIEQEKIVKGDRKVLSIAAASIAAKVTRDRIMRRMDMLFPGYGFAKHKGYPTRQHIQALRRLGPCVLHRKTYGPVRELMKSKV